MGKNQSPSVYIKLLEAVQKNLTIYGGSVAGVPDILAAVALLDFVNVLIENGGVITADEFRRSAAMMNDLRRTVMEVLKKHKRFKVDDQQRLEVVFNHFRLLHPTA